MNNNQRGQIVKQFKSILLLVIFSLISLVNLGCSENLIPPLDDNSINIEFPIGKKAIYAIGFCTGFDDSLITESVSIVSLQFDTVLSNNNAKEYIGNIDGYTKSFLIEDSNKVYMDFYSGKVVLSMDDKWVLFQYSESINAFNLFFKQNIIQTDTTILPTFYYNQLPVFPKKIKENSFYSAYRPSDHDLFGALQRDFDFKKFVEWNDEYENNIGIYFKTQHIMKFASNLNLEFKGIIDDHGVVISSIDFGKLPISTIENPMGTDSINVHQINRRLVDFTESENVRELSWYADLVREHGLKPLNIE